MSDLFQIICKSCGSKLNAKVSLIGQARNCPKCKTLVLIQREESQEEEQITPIITNSPSIALLNTSITFGDGTRQIENLPEQLQYRNQYFIIGLGRMIAIWESGKGWQVKIGNGFASAKKNFSAIPDQGTFAFVELVMGSTGIPEKLNVFKISLRGALTSLYRDDKEILHKIDCSTVLTKNQKNILLNYLRQHFMFEVLAEAKNVIDDLNSP